MLLPLLIAVVSVVLGALLGLSGRRGSVSAISTFAMIAALAVVVAQLLPDALSEIGLWALVVFAVALLVPSLAEKSAHRLGAKHSNRWGLELGYAALIVHKLGDGVALGTYATGTHEGHTHLDVFLAIAAHDVPVIALVTMAYHASGGVRAVAGRCGGLGLATMAGVFLPALIPASTYASYEPWVTAAIAGLLLHVVAHDWSPELKVPKSARGRLVDLLAVVGGIALVILGGHGHEHGHEAGATKDAIASSLLELSIETAPALLLGLVVGALLTAAGSKLPTRWLRSGGALGQAFRGAVVGAPLPICACGVLPLAATLRKRGAGAALVVAFLIATPELGIETFALTASFVGWPFALIRLGAAVGLAMIAALVIHRVTRSTGAGHLEADVLESAAPEGSFLERAVEAFDELLYHVAPWTVVGLIAAAYVQAVVDTGSLGAMRAYGLDVLVVTAVAVPSYVCAASATPLAAVLLANGMSPGAVLVGLLLGPATNLATIGFLRKTFGGRATLVGVAAVVVSAWGFAGLLNVVDVPLELDVARVGAHEHGWIALGASGLLALALLRSVWRTGLRAWLASIGEGLGGGHDHHHHNGHHHHHHHHHGHGDHEPHDHDHDHDDHDHVHAT